MVSPVECRNTAVPGTRVGGSDMCRSDVTNSWSSPSNSVRLRSTIPRPRRQVISTTKMTSPTVSENQPPCGTFGRLAAKKARSTVRKTATPVSTIDSGLPHWTRTTTKNRIVSIASVPVTAMP